MRLKLFYILILSSSAAAGQNSSANHSLRTEYLVDPLGIDVAHPRFTWKMESSTRGAVQTAWQVLVSTDSSAVAKGTANVWNSGKTRGSSMLVEYKGPSLKPFTKYFWTIKTWDPLGVLSRSSAISKFETGMMQQTNWKGTWISDNQRVNVKPAPYFRKDFKSSKKIRSARAYIAAGGLYELHLNGEKVGNHRLDPVYTRYDRRLTYVTYDVTKHLTMGDNAIGVLLGNGWYNHQSTAVWDFERAPWRARPTFVLDLRITYDDGTMETISSGKNWKTSGGPLVFNSIYTAEHYDARLEIPGWNRPGFDESKWKNVINRSAPANLIVSQVIHPIRNVEEIKPVKVSKINDTTYLFDLGRNISGVTKFSYEGASGEVIRLKHGERLKPDGRLDMSNIDVHYRPTDDTDPFQTDIFILSGRARENFMPLFNYKGFQYIEVTSSKPLTLTAQNLTGYFMHSDVPKLGTVRSSNPTLNKLWWATNNSYLSNLFGYPTDCPQREKNGWTGDAQIAVETGLYNFDGITIYEKWLADHRDEQQPNGVLPSIIPTGGWGYEWGNGPDWTSTIAIIPWNIYLFYGDTRILKDNYENMTRYVDHITDIAPSGLTSWGLGDWVPVKSKASVELTSTAYYFADVQILAKVARILGKPEDQERYEKLAVKIKNAFNTKFYNKGQGSYNTGIQTELAVPLFWGLVPAGEQTRVAASLAERVKQDNFHLDVGLLGTKAILNALSQNGYSDIAYKVASQETFPSWGWWIVNGATTLYENWPIEAGSDISRNHIMFGEIGAWMYKGLGGIFPDESAPGFKRVILKPNFVKGLQKFEAEFNGPYGMIRSAWFREGQNIRYEITVPANSSAVLELPGSMKVSEGGKALVGVSGNPGKYRLGSGKYDLVLL